MNAAQRAPLPIVQVDAFTAEPFAGNPAAVCVLPADFPPGDAWMRALAREMNLSETAFLRRQGEAWSLRWFTPAVEVDLCGHATLASAHVLWEDGHLDPATPARFDTRSGLLTCTRASSGRIEMDFPAKIAAACETPAELLAALGVAGPRFVGKNAFDYFVELDEDDAVRALAPNHSRLRTLPVRGIIVTARARAGADYDFVSRFFAPGSGVDEDPVTGSSHCALAPHWSERLGRDELVGYQASARGGRVHTRLAGSRVVLGGSAVTVLRGELVPAALP
jgi:PhzF family phenazine biosynthesis protein